MTDIIATVKNYSFEIVLLTCLLFLLLFGLYRRMKGHRGTWTRGMSARGLGTTVYSTMHGSLQQFIAGCNKSQRRGVMVGDDYMGDFGRAHNPRESKGEIECRRVLESRFRRPFHKARPAFLRNTVTEHYNLELDCVNMDLRLAVEYNGAQHYKYIPYFHKNKEAFLNQKYRDDMKRRLCKDHGIALVEVPYTVKVEDIEMFIVAACRRLGYNC